ncbi:MAG: nodulation protein NfeD [Chloroflexi bacterium]|nr:nodulation protein NfeD [Chloroflexota bacterium]
MARRQLLRRWCIGVLLALGVAWLALASIYPTAGGQSPYVAVATIDGPIDIVATRYLERVIDEAWDTDAALLVVRLNTPGGLAESTRDMVGLILESRVPVAVYVSPAGSQAASAGTFVTAAAHFAVMAPGTNIGAASPVTASGEDVPATLSDKISEDTRAFIRSIAERRGRDAAALEATVTEARSYTAGEAEVAGIVDFIAEDLDDLLRQADGAEVTTTRGTQQVSVAGLQVRPLDPSGVERFLAVLANPGLALVLLVVGGFGLLVEFSAPGLGVPGIVGVVAFALAFTGLGQLPVNWLGVLLILAALGLAVLEIQAAGFGVFGASAVAAFVVGAFLLGGDAFRVPEIDIPEIEIGVNPWLIGVLGGVFAAVIAVIAWALRSDRGRAASSYVSPTSETALVGQLAEVTHRLDPRGEVRLAGERWEAELPAGRHADVGERVMVRDVEGLRLRVEIVQESASEAPTVTG